MNRKLVLAKGICGLLVALLLVSGAAAAPDEGRPSHEQRISWWRGDRFGMFIHWGLYAVPAGEYGGKQHEGIGEWIMNTARIPRADYERFAPEFNPYAFDADAWVRMAKYAGMRYIVITSKHHDGFCLFNADNTQYDVADATPFGKDVLKLLSGACQRHGVKFCTYYSIMDWHHPAQLPAKLEDGKPVWNPTRIKESEKKVYTRYMKEHLRALVADYKTQVLWFDGEWPDWWTDKDGQEIYEFLLELNPNLIVNNRVGAGRKGMSGFSREGSFAGDFGTPEQEIPATGVDSDWESCMTMNDTWGYQRSDNNWKSTQTLIRNLIDIASKGGNYLLNIGPEADGTFPEASVERLRGIGDWMAVNGEAIYGTQAALFRPEWGRVTRKSGTLYLHVFEWPEDGRLTIPALNSAPRRVSLLARPESALEIDASGDQWSILVPSKALDANSTVIAVDVEGMPALSP